LIAEGTVVSYAPTEDLVMVLLHHSETVVKVPAAALRVISEWAPQPHLLPLTPALLPALRYFLSPRVGCLSPSTVIVSEIADEGNVEDGKSKGKKRSNSIGLRAPRLGPLSQHPSSDANDEFVAMSSRLRCSALRTFALLLKHKQSVSVLVEGGILPGLLKVAATDIAVAPLIALGATAAPKSDGGGSNDKCSALELPAVSALVAKLGESVSLARLEALSSRLWQRLQHTRCSSSWWRRQHHQRLECLGGEVQMENYRVMGVSNFPSVRLSSVALRPRDELCGLKTRRTDAEGSDGVDNLGVDCVNGGAWYYEAVLLTEGLMQIGWADELFASDPANGQGVGDHCHSWAFDGYRRKKWNGGSTDYGRRWQVGDVLGCLLDMDVGDMRFFLNGVDLGSAFIGFCHPGLHLAPAASFNAGQAVRFNFGHAPFMHLPTSSNGSTPLPISEARAPKLMGHLADPSDKRGAAGVRRSGDEEDHDAVGENDDEEGDEDDDEDDEHQEGMQEGELRRQALIENLIGMGFPVEWAIRASEDSDARQNESVAIAWIIEQMEMENAKEVNRPVCALC
jgi:hypothetical protein